MAEYRLDELATLSGIRARNIRAYRERGLLDPPRRVGRSAVYNHHHLAALRTINELLGRGFTSAHIAEFFTSVREGHDLADVLGLHEAIFGEDPRAAAVAIDIDPDGDDARRLVRYGLAEVVDGGLTLVNPNIAAALGSVVEREQSGQTILRVADAIAGVLDELAAAVVRASEASLAARSGENYVAGPEDMVELRKVIVAYRELVRHVVADQFESALQRQIVSAVSEDTTDIVVGGHWDQKDRCAEV